MRPFFGSVSPLRRAPSTSTSPLSGVTSPAIIDTVVVLPAPFGPSSPTRVPRLTANETSSTATSGPNDFRRCWMLSMSLSLEHLGTALQDGWTFPTNGRFHRTNGVQAPVSHGRGRDYRGAFA